MLGNRRPLYRLLFRSAAWALQQSLREECGRPAASTMVLHTWNQRLGHHPHLHALVPGSGPSLDGTLHILPKGFTKSRCYGGWSNTRRRAYQQQCERLQPLPPSTAVDLPEPSPPVLESPLDEMLTCPHCKTAMVLESHTRRPS